MLKRIVIILPILALLGSCESEETLSPREYPFVQSLEIKAIDNTGATVEFEILKPGKSSVDSYGVEYLEASIAGSNVLQKVYYKQEITQVPTSNIISIRIEYDLQDGESYFVRPYVKSQGKTIYGSTLNFQSKGVRPPEIKEVSQSTISGNSNIVIKGNYFNSKLELNTVEIPGIEEYFRINLISASREELVVSLEKNFRPFPLTKNNYDLVVKSGGRSVVLEDYFTIGYPFIKSINPLSGYVGDEINLIFQTFNITSGLNLNFSLSELISPIYSLPPIENENQNIQLVDTPPGKYRVILTGQSFVSQFEEEFEVLDSWEIYRENAKLPVDLNNVAQIFVGDYLVTDIQGKGDYQSSSSYNFKSNTTSTISPKANNAFVRSQNVETAGSGRFLYYGLGRTFKENQLEYLDDFSRLDLESGRWQDLAPFPKANPQTLNSFELQGKIYVILSAHAKFSIYDPIANSWGESSYNVPTSLRNATQVAISGGEIYFTERNFSQNATIIYRLRLGGQPEILTSLPINFNQPKLYALDGKLIIFFGPNGIQEFSLLTKKQKPIQGFTYFRSSAITPWLTSEGLHFIYPMEFSGNVANTTIYKLR